MDHGKERGKGGRKKKEEKERKKHKPKIFFPMLPLHYPIFFFLFCLYNFLIPHLYKQEDLKIVEDCKKSPHNFSLLLP